MEQRNRKSETSSSAVAGRDLERTTAFRAALDEAAEFENDSRNSNPAIAVDHDETCGGDDSPATPTLPEPVQLPRPSSNMFHAEAETPREVNPIPPPKRFKRDPPRTPASATNPPSQQQQQPQQQAPPVVGLPSDGSHPETPVILTESPVEPEQPYDRVPRTDSITSQNALDSDGDDGEIDREQAVFDSLPRTPMAAIEHRHSSGGSSSPSDLSSSSRGGGNGDEDFHRKASLSPVVAFPEVPPAPPSTPASDFLQGTPSNRFDGLTATPVPSLPYSGKFYNADQLEQQQLLAEGAVTPAPTRTKEREQRKQPNEAEITSSSHTSGGAHKRQQPPLSDDFSEWAVGERYQLLRMLGRGSYGEVAQALDTHQGRSDAYVAIKRIQSPFDQEVDAVRLFREIHILRRLRGHECIIQLLDVVQPPSEDLDEFNDLYLVFECKQSWWFLKTTGSMLVILLVSPLTTLPSFYLGRHRYRSIQAYHVSSISHDGTHPNLPVSNARRVEVSPFRLCHSS